MSSNHPEAPALDSVQGVVATVTRASRSLDDRLTVLAVRMLILSLSFFVATWFFALTYLQIVNSNGQWLPTSVHRPLGWGVVELALVLASALVYFWAQLAGLYRQNWGRLQLGLWVALACGVAAIVVHILEFYHLNFNAQSGGWASVFIGANGMYTVLLSVSMLALLGVANRTRLGLTRENGIAIDAFGEFWGWMAGVGTLVFLGLYVQPFFPIA